MSSETHPSDLPAWEAARLAQLRPGVEPIYTNILDRYLTNQRLTADVDSGQLPRINAGRAEVTQQLDPRSKQIVLAASYGDLGIVIGRYDPARDNFVTFPELLTLEERYLLHEKRLQHILEKEGDDVKRLFPPEVSGERRKQADVMAPLIDDLLDFYGTVTKHDIYADDATGIYIRQDREPGEINVSVALEHAFTLHRRGDEVGVKRHALTRIPVITCDRVNGIDLTRKEKYASPETAATVLGLAQEAGNLWNSETMGRRLDLTFMRYN